MSTPSASWIAANSIRKDYLSCAAAAVCLARSSVIVSLAKAPSFGRRSAPPDKRRSLFEDALLRCAAAWLKTRHVKVAQALLSPAEAERAAALPRNGFAHVTHLLFLRRDLALFPARPKSRGRLEYQPRDLANPSLFHQTLQNTYKNTLDCPELNGVRTVEDVIAGHKGESQFDPDLWLLALADGRPVGVLLLMRSPETHDWEISYLGVVLEARRKGFGRELVWKARHRGAVGRRSLPYPFRGRSQSACPQALPRSWLRAL